ncbi:MAG: hypothetical protein SWZ49_01190 [Cyanobacteriota bacterium]|nr:hypothetical protein [Cyanobacteriota bacterium]
MVQDIRFIGLSLLDRGFQPWLGLNSQLNGGNFVFFMVLWKRGFV